MSIYEKPEKGLYYQAKFILDTQKAREIYALLRFGAPIHSALLYMKSKSIMDAELIAEEGVKVFSSLWVMMIALCSAPLCFTDPITKMSYNK